MAIKPSRYAWQLGRDRIDNGLQKLQGAPGTAIQKPDHLAVFALAPIPLLVYHRGRFDHKTPSRSSTAVGSGRPVLCWPDPSDAGPSGDVPQFAVSAGDDR
jgi:hypothetical protein